MSSSLVVRVIGPLTVSIGGIDRHPPAGRVGEVLARLALADGRPVPVDTLIEDLWDDEQPANPVNALQAVIARLRRWLDEQGADPRAVATVGAAYQLHGATTDVDEVTRLEAAARTARAADDPQTAARLADEALDRFRSEPLVDLAYREWAQPHVRAIEETARRLQEDLAADLLEYDRPDELTPRLEQLVADEPLRERRWQLLMIAMYRSGRQADALAAFQRARSILRDRLGVDPGPDLVATEAAILRHDETLRPPTKRRGRNNVVTPLTRLLGRDRELASVLDHLARERLITIVGPGGVGKTRLAVEVATRVVDAVEDGDDVWFVDLAPVTSPDAIDESVAAALQLRDAGSVGTVRDAIADALGHRPVVLFLDNCEHLVDPVTAFAEELLGRCPRLRIVATSREVLAVPGAVTWPLAPLSPDDAVTLFVERATAAAPDRADGLDGGLVAAICDRLDHLPLAIELAAARVRVLSASEVHDRLDDRFALLTGGSRPALRRQQTLRAVIDWSYELLFDDERSVFEHLAVFVGDFDVDGAVAVTGPSGVDRTDVVTILTRLVEKSLVVSRPSSGRSTFRMLESLAEYGRDRLVERGGLDRALEAHAAHAVASVARSAAALSGERQLDFLALVRDHRPDLAAALERLQDRSPPAALELATNLGWTWWVSGRVREGIHQLGRALDAAVDAPPQLRAWAGAWYAYLSFLVGDSLTLERAEDAERQLHESPASVEAAYTASLLSEIHAVGGDPGRGARLARWSVELAAVVDDHTGLPDYFRARVAVGEGRARDALRHFAAAAERLESSGEHVIRSLALSSLADLADRRGDHPGSVAYATRAVESISALGLENATAALRVRLGHALLHGGELDRAERVLADSLTTGRSVGFPPTTCAALGGLATAAWLRGDLDEAAELAEEALAVAGPVGLWSHVVVAHCILASCAMDDARFGDPTALAAGALAAAERGGDPRSVARSRLTSARATASADPDTARRTVREVGTIWRRHGLVPSAVEHAELADAERRLGPAATR